MAEPFTIHDFKTQPGFSYTVHAEGEVIVAIKVAEAGKPAIELTEGSQTILGTVFTIGERWRPLQQQEKHHNLVRFMLIEMANRIHEPKLELVK